MEVVDGGGDGRGDSSNNTFLNLHERLPVDGKSAQLFCAQLYKVQCLQTSVNIGYLCFLLPNLLVTDSQRGFIWEGCELPLGSRAGVNCTNTFE